MSGTTLEGNSLDWVEVSRFANNSQKDYRVSNNVNSLALSAMPFIGRVARTLPADTREDAAQTGFLTAMQLASVWSPTTGFPFLSPANQKSIRRDMLRETARLEPENLKLIRAGNAAYSLDANSESDFSEESNEPAAAGDSEAAVLEDTNSDPEQTQLHSELIAAIESLPEDGRNCMAHVLAGFTVSEFAREYALTQSSADRLYQRSLEALREKLCG